MVGLVAVVTGAVLRVAATGRRVAVPDVADSYSDSEDNPTIGLRREDNPTIGLPRVAVAGPGCRPHCCRPQMMQTTMLLTQMLQKLTTMLQTTNIS